MRKAQKGNEKDFLTVFQQYEVDIYRMAFLYVKNQEDALDVVQEVAYQSFKNIHTLNKPQYFKTWLMKITINCAVNLVKRNMRDIPLNQEFEDYSSSTDEDIPLSLTLQDLIEKLQVEEKSVVLLKFYKNFTFKEISEVLGIPLGTAKSVLYRALDKLRKEIREVDIYE